MDGYRVLYKWLSDRKGRTLLYDDLRHYGFIVSALFEPIGTMSEIDGAIAAHGGWPLKSLGGLLPLCLRSFSETLGLEYPHAVARQFPLEPGHFKPTPRFGQSVFSFVQGGVPGG